MTAATATAPAPQPQSPPPAAGVVVYSGHCYDKRLRRCRIYGVADGRGSVEWRIVRESFDGDEDDVERCFRTYAEAMRWLA
jgi:hypothetical protein